MILDRLIFFLDLEVPGDTPETDERCRNIERGGRLVTVTPSTFGVTLQMPRGNLETIYPRALVLAGIRTFIDQKDYRSAFLACRSQMVDMNILHDYAPEQFMENIQLFVDQVKKMDYIDEFISRLRCVLINRHHFIHPTDLHLVRMTSRRLFTKTHSRSLNLRSELFLIPRRMQCFKNFLERAVK